MSYNFVKFIYLICKTKFGDSQPLGVPKASGHCDLATRTKFAHFLLQNFNWTVAATAKKISLRNLEGSL